MRLKHLLVFFFLIATPISLLAKDVPFEVIPWNGYKAALSLTYDDGDPIHLDVAIPEMNKRGLRGTFYIITSKVTRIEDWKKAVAAGQEIGNHTVTHRHTSELKPDDEKNEVVDAKKFLQDTFGVPVLTLAYPFVEISPGLEKWTKAEDFAARGGGGTPYLTPDMEPDWYNIPSQTTMTAYAYETYKGWADQDLAAGAWTVLMIHGIEGTQWGWQPITKKNYLQLLDYLVQNKKSLWVAPFGEVCAYWRAQKVLEGAEPKKDGNATTLKWDIPANFPKGVQVKLSIQGDGLKVSQGGKEVKPLSAGVYAVAFDAKELTLENALWKPQVVPTPKTVTAQAAVVDTSSVVAAPSKDVLKVDDFESGTPAYGGGWWAGCDGNGVTKLSPLPFAALTGGSPLTPGHCAGMKGHMGPMEAPWPWAILSENLDAGGKPVDLSAYKAIRFYTQGDGKTHSVALNKAAVTDYSDFQGLFVSPAKWTQVTINFSDFAQPTWGKQVDKNFKDVVKLSFTPAVPGEDFDFKVDDIEFLK